MATWNGMAAGVEVGDDRLERPVPVAVDHVAPVAGRQQLGVEPGIDRPGLGVWAHAHGVEAGIVGLGHVVRLAA
jgi:hypothetical protein